MASTWSATARRRRRRRRKKKQKKRRNAEGLHRASELRRHKALPPDQLVAFRAIRHAQGTVLHGGAEGEGRWRGQRARADGEEAKLASRGITRAARAPGVVLILILKSDAVYGFMPGAQALRVLIE